MSMTPDQLRSAYLDFFASKQHRVVPSAPVVPEGDPTLMFTNAGMNQFKDVLLGLEKRDYDRATSVQKCIRAGGKHNDLDEVGKDGRHLTFFEMLGNWSFGEYYKREAIAWAWEFITQVVKLDPARLYVSVYTTDDEAHRIWAEEIGLSEDRIIRLEEDNFWAMGPTGPCGPCSEIYYDNHPEAGPAVWDTTFDEDRMVEIWNLVFMESNAEENGDMTPLPLQSVDTGMGLDRVAAVLAGVDNVFQTDLFSGILVKTHELRTGETVEAASLHDHEDFTAYCVIADHIRSVLFSICDGAKFSNEGRGYVLRRILRRAVRYGRDLGFDGPFLNEVADAVIASFQHVYAELRIKGNEAKTLILTEEKRFFRTIDRGIALFVEVAEQTEAAGEKEIDGLSVFKLYDTFGFPPDLTRIMAEERGLTIDEHGYQAAMQAQKKQSQAADDRYQANGEWNILQDGAADGFIGYEHTEAVSDVLRYRINEDETVDICLRETPFYAESGGQVGDTGTIASEDGVLELFVRDTQKTTAGITHHCDVRLGTLTEGRLRLPVSARVDTDQRHLTACNHTATHLLHAALHKFVGEQAFQAGSRVAPDRLRFDFSAEAPVSQDKITAIEAWVNARIRDNEPVRLHLNVALEDAERMGAMMIFGEKYGERVRVVEVPGHSTELCGGIHVRETNDIGYFRVISETGVAAGVRRIEAVTNERAFELAASERTRLIEIAAMLKGPQTAIEDRIQRLLDNVKDLERKIDMLSASQAKSAAGDLTANAIDVDGVQVVAAEVSAPDRQTLLTMADHLRDKLADQAVVLLGAAIEGKPALLVLVTDGAFKGRGLKAGPLVNAAASHVGGKGGGKPTLAQAGGKDASKIGDAVSAFADAVRETLS